MIGLNRTRTAPSGKRDVDDAVGAFADGDDDKMPSSMKTAMGTVTGPTTWRKWPRRRQT